MSVATRTMAAIRFGYGFHPDQHAPDGAEAVLRQIAQGTGAPLLIPMATTAERVARLQAYGQTRKAGGETDALRALRKGIRRDGIVDTVAKLVQRALSPLGFYERLVAFWGDHFTVSGSTSGQYLMLPMFETEAIRPHLAGTFADLLIASTRHPVMLTYLDQTASFGPGSRAGSRRGRGLNENLAREVLELHTIGVGGPYGQTDVREFAELLTGWGVNNREGVFRFFRDRAEPGAETVLGQRYGGDPARASDAEAALRDLAVHPATAAHLARKLAVHFVADTPDEDLVRHLTAAWTGSGGDLPTVYRALLDHPAAWRGFGAKIKQPADLLVSTMRAAGITARGSRRLTGKDGLGLLKALRAMNQVLHRPPGPDGWPEDAGAWITPQGLAARLDFATGAGHLLAARSDLDPRAFAEQVLHDALRPETAFAVGGAPDRWEGFALTLASPEFNRR